MLSSYLYVKSKLDKLRGQNVIPVIMSQKCDLNTRQNRRFYTGLPTKD